MKRISSLTYVLVVAALLTLPAVSFAGVPSDRVKSATDKVIEILKDPSLKGPSKEDQKRKKIRAAVSEVFDFSEMAKRSLGMFWKDRTPAQKAEFTGLFTDLIERSYINRIEGYSNEKIVFDGETADKDYAVVKTRFINRRQEEIPVDYKLFSDNGQWRVYDVVIENVGLVNNYRVQFNKIIRGSGYDDLIRKMKSKSETENFEAPSAKK